MSRLTDQHLTNLERIIRGDDGVRSIMFPWMQRAIDEIRERRAADGSLSIVCQLVREVLDERPPIPGQPNTTHARLTQSLSILDRLLSQKVGG